MTYAAIIARHRPAAFGGVGIDANKEAGFIASHYRHYRVTGRHGVREALQRAKELPAAYVKGREYYGVYPAWGAPMKRGHDTIRHVADYRAAGLRHLGYADDINKRIGKGWYTDDDCHGALRGAVFLLPGKGKAARLVYGYCEMEGEREMNKGSALISVSHIVTSRAEDSYLMDSPEAREAAGLADGMAEQWAEDQRDYQRAYNEGRKAAEKDGEAGEARKAALPLLAEFRAVRRGRMILSEVMCELLQSSIRSALYDIRQTRTERDHMWSECGTYQETAWLDGFADHTESGRAVALGYMKAQA